MSVPKVEGIVPQVSYAARESSSPTCGTIVQVMAEEIKVLSELLK